MKALSLHGFLDATKIGYAGNESVGASAFSLEDQPQSGRPRIYLIHDHAQVKALAREFPAQRERLLSRYSTRDLVRMIHNEKKFPRMSGSTS